MEERKYDPKLGSNLSDEYIDRALSNIEKNNNKSIGRPNKCRHPYRLYCYASNLLKETEDAASYHFNYCPDCGQRLKKGD